MQVNQPDSFRFLWRININVTGQIITMQLHIKAQGDDMLNPYRPPLLSPPLFPPFISLLILLVILGRFSAWLKISSLQRQLRRQAVHGEVHAASHAGVICIGGGMTCEVNEE